MDKQNLDTITTALIAGIEIKTHVSPALQLEIVEFRALVVGRYPRAADALQLLEHKPDSVNRRGVLAEELEAAGAGQDQDVVGRAGQLLAMLQTTQVPGAHTVVNTGGGAYIAGSVNTGGGAFVGRDQINQAPPHSNPGDAAGIAISESGRKAYAALDQWFADTDIEEIAFNLDIDWGNLRGETKSEKARALVTHCETRGRMTELRTEILKARPQLGDQV